MISDRDVREAVDKDLLKGETDKMVKIDAEVYRVYYNLAQAYISVEMPEEKHGKHENCWDIDGDYCITHGEDVDIHPSYISGFNEALLLCKLVLAKDKMRVEELMEKQKTWEKEILQRAKIYSEIEQRKSKLEEVLRKIAKGISSHEEDGTSSTGTHPDSRSIAKQALGLTE